MNRQIAADAVRIVRDGVPATTSLVPSTPASAASDAAD